jgi:membrane fusion protein (multidrug efflux system)
MENENSPTPTSNAPPVAHPKNGGRKRAGIILLILIAICVIGGLRWWLWGKSHIRTDNAFVETHIHAVASRVPGMIARVMVQDNQPVKKGDLLVEIDPTDYRLRVEGAAAALSMAGNETSGEYAKVEAARADLGQSRARLEQAAMDLKRGKNLFEREVIPKEQLERLTTAHDVAAAQVREKEEEVRKARAEIGLSGSGGRDAKIAQRRAQLSEARLSLDYTKITAPTDGYVTRKSAEVGNYIQPGQPLLAIVPLKESWVTANYKESQLTHVRPGQQVSFTVDAYPGNTFKGTVESIMAGTGAAFSLLPPENATGNYVKVVQRVPVKIAIDRSSDPGQLLRVGMSVVPTIDTRRRTAELLQDLNPFR